MSPSGWSARGDSNPDLHGLNVPRLPIAPRAEMVPPGGLEPPPHGLRARHAALTLQRGMKDANSGANDGIRTRTSRLGRPVGDRYPTFALVWHCQLSKNPLRRAVEQPHTRHLHLHRLEDSRLSWPGWPVSFRRARGQNKKGLPGVALEGLVLDECRPFRALRPPCGYRASRRGDLSTCTP